MKVTPEQLEKQARYLMSVACLVKDAAKHDELQQKAQALLVEKRAGLIQCSVAACAK